MYNIYKYLNACIVALGSCLCVCVDMYLSTCYIWYMYIYIHMYICIQGAPLPLCVCVRVNMYTCICRIEYLHIYVYLHTQGNICMNIHVWIYLHTQYMYMSYRILAYICIYLHTQGAPFGSCLCIRVDTGWRRPIRCLKLQVIFRKRATEYRALLRKMTCKDRASYGSSPPCMYMCNLNI